MSTATTPANTLSAKDSKAWKDYASLAKQASDRLATYRKKRTDLEAAFRQSRDFTQEYRDERYQKLRDAAEADLKKIAGRAESMQAAVGLLLDGADTGSERDATTAMLVDSTWQKVKALLDLQGSDATRLLKEVEHLSTEAVRTSDRHVLAALKANIPSYFRTVMYPTTRDESRTLDDLTKGALDQIAATESPVDAQVRLAWAKGVKNVTLALRLVQKDLDEERADLVLPDFDGQMLTVPAMREETAQTLRRA